MRLEKLSPFDKRRTIKRSMSDEAILRQLWLLPITAHQVVAGNDPLIAGADEIFAEYKASSDNDQRYTCFGNCRKLENAEERLTARMRRLLDVLWREWKHLQLQIESLSEDLEKIASSDEACARLRQIPGVGPLVATALVSAIGKGAATGAHSRNGTLPRQRSLPVSCATRKWAR